MIHKIVSNGRIGVARGALDAALALDIPHSGWGIPDNAREDGPLPPKIQSQGDENEEQDPVY